MKFQVTLLLVCTLFSGALAVLCLQCVPQIQGTCPDEGKELNCPAECVTLTYSVQKDDVMTNISAMTCGSSSLCLSGSMNLGSVKVSTNAKCCSTDRCNSEILPVLSDQISNGGRCHVCNTSDCKGTVDCKGSEDRCITASVTQGSNSVSVKGCVSNNICAASEMIQETELLITEVKCCEGNLCNADESSGGSSGNDAERFTPGFFLMIVPLLCAMLFY